MATSPEAIKSMTSDLNRAFKSAQQAEWSFAFEILDYLEAQPHEVANLSSDPAEFMRSKGFKLPEDFHMHYVDETGKRYPPEQDSDPSSITIRPEVSISRNGKTLAWCFTLCINC